MIAYSNVEMAFIFVSMSPSGEHYAYLNKETGGTCCISEIGDSDQLPDDLEERGKFINIPHKNDLGLGRKLVFDFVSANFPEQFEKVHGIFSRKGACAV